MDAIACAGKYKDQRGAVTGKCTGRGHEDGGAGGGGTVAALCTTRIRSVRPIRPTGERALLNLASFFSIPLSSAPAPIIDP